MEAIDLPLIPSSTSVADALDVLEQKKRAGLIVENGNEYTLLYWRHLLQADHDQIRLVSGINDGIPVHLLTHQDAITHSIDLVRPLKSIAQYGGFFSHPSRESLDFALAGATQDVAIVVTRSEAYKDLLASSTGGFKCTGRPVHFFPDPTVKNGDRCPKYPPCRGYIMPR
jgi:CBS domain-containing protein